MLKGMVAGTVLSLAATAAAAQGAHPLAGDWRLLAREGGGETWIDVASLGNGRARTADFRPKVPLEAQVETFVIDCAAKTARADVIWVIANGGTAMSDLSNPGEPTDPVNSASRAKVRGAFNGVCRGSVPSGPGAPNLLPLYKAWKARN